MVHLMTIGAGHCHYHDHVVRYSLGHSFSGNPCKLPDTLIQLGFTRPILDVTEITDRQCLSACSVIGFHFDVYDGFSSARFPTSFSEGSAGTFLRDASGTDSH